LSTSIYCICQFPQVRIAATLNYQIQIIIKDMKTQEPTGIIQIKRQGPPSVLEYTKETVSAPGQYQVLIRQEAIAVNFVDIMFRNGSFPINNLPATIGVEAAGVIESVGSGVDNFAIGDRVAYYFSLGAYAERRIISADDLVKIPDDVAFDQAASLMAKGLTARMLVKQAYAVQPGDVILVHAAAGGVGSLVSKWAKALGATVIGTVGNSAKKALAISAGIDHVVALDSEDLHEAVMSYTANRGVKAAFDGVGKATFEKSTPLIQNGGTVVLYGTASGAPRIDSAYLATKQIKLVQPTLGQYLQDQASIETATSELFEALRTGILGTIVPTVYPLADVAKAHQDLESSQTTGSIVLHP
jgi:NADPH2:quinone reductase